MTNRLIGFLKDHPEFKDYVYGVYVDPGGGICPEKDKFTPTLNMVCSPGWTDLEEFTKWLKVPHNDWVFEPYRKYEPDREYEELLI